MTARTIKVRATEHRNTSSTKGLYYHMHSCPDYLSRLNKFKNDNLRHKDRVRARQKMRERRKSEAYFLRIYRPNLNDQKTNVFFS